VPQENTKIHEQAGDSAMRRIVHHSLYAVPVNSGGRAKYDGNRVENHSPECAECNSECSCNADPPPIKDIDTLVGKYWKLAYDEHERGVPNNDAANRFVNKSATLFAPSRLQHIRAQGVWEFVRSKIDFIQDDVTPKRVGDGYRPFASLPTRTAREPAP